MALPNFFIVGAPRCGTTSLYHQLGRHPEIFMAPVKEPHYFSDRREKGGLPSMSEAEYASLFGGAKLETMVGEASPSYLHCEASPLRLREFCPEAKIIVLLREPLRRSYSHFCMTEYGLRQRNSPPLEEFKLEAQHRKNLGTGSGAHGAFDQSFYAAAVRRYLSIFPVSQVFVGLHEERFRDPQAFLREVFAFLDVRADLAIASDKKPVNASPYAARFRFFHSALMADSAAKRIVQKILPTEFRKTIMGELRRINGRRPGQLPDELVSELWAIFDDDVKELECVLGRDLNLWRPVA